LDAYEILENGQVIGRFYLDMHPRDGKFSHAANFPIRGGIEGRVLPVGALLCNFPDGLMEHGDVEVFLHEFGHMLHSMFSGRQRWAQGNYGEVEWDFIEAPSTLLEEWIWDYDTLSRFARNAEGEAISRDLVDRMNAARMFGEGEATLVQLGYASASLNYYNRDPAGLDLAAAFRENYERYAPYRMPAAVHQYASFGHLDGYSAIYYTYQWSTAIAVDLFSVFRQNGMRDQATFRRYREEILAPGGSASANTLIREFLGRDTTVDAYAHRLRQED
ncbi:MAG: M3 family metallopeptidase, partial [Hyphomonadaceae bacterium]